MPMMRSVYNLEFSYTYPCMIGYAMPMAIWPMRNAYDI